MTADVIYPEFEFSEHKATRYVGWWHVWDEGAPRGTETCQYRGHRLVMVKQFDGDEFTRRIDGYVDNVYVMTVRGSIETFCNRLFAHVDQMHGDEVKAS